MKGLFSVLFLFTTALSTFAKNDVFYLQGVNLYSNEETFIFLKHSVLPYSYFDNTVRVDIFLTFLYHFKTTPKTVDFVTLPN